MLTHEAIWAAIDRLAEQSGYSTSGLAKRAGLDPTSFNRSKRTAGDGKLRWPSTESLARILTATDSSIENFFSLIEDGTKSKPNLKSNSIPLLPFSSLCEEIMFDAEGGLVSRVSVSKKLGNHTLISDSGTEALYAIEMKEDDYAPVFRRGDKIVISPLSPVRQGDRVVIKTVAGDVLVREFSQKTPRKVVVKNLVVESSDEIYQSSDILWVARIILVSQ